MVLWVNSLMVNIETLDRADLLVMSKNIIYFPGNTGLAKEQKFIIPIEW